MARQAGIVSVQIFSRFGPGACGGADCVLSYTSDMIRGLRWVAGIAASHHVSAVNMSLGGGRFAATCDGELIKETIDELRGLGVATVIAAGNDGDKGGVSYPGCVSSAVTVGASSDRAPDAVASFSNSSTLVDLLAPGTSITSSVPSGRYADYSGTSMATPHVAGAIAALSSKVAAATADEIVRALESTGVPVRDAGNGRVIPRIAMHAALHALDAAPSWKGWETLTSDAAGPPDCEPTGSQQIDCWVQTAGYRLGWSRYVGARWAPWADLGGALGSAPDCLQGAGALHCFATGLNGQLRQTTYDGRTWGAWKDHGGSLIGRPSCVALGSQRIACFALGTDRQLWQLGFDGRAWGTATSLRGSLSSRPSCYAVGSAIDCYALDAAGRLATIVHDGRSWGRLTNLGGSLASPPSCVFLGARIKCFARGTDGSLQTIRHDGRSWGRLTSLGGSIGSQPDCVRLGGTGQLVCVAVGSTGGLLEIRYDGKAWGGFTDLGGGLTSDLARLVQNGARLDVFARGSTGTVQHDAWY